jgi:uncharacterized protein YndB with AHSA1/START domain
LKRGKPHPEVHGGVKMDPEKWKRFTQIIYVEAPIDTVYASMTTAKGMTGWSSMEAALTAADGTAVPPGEPAVPGTRFHLLWHTGHDESGEFLEANGTDRLRYTFGEGIEVAFDLEEVDDGTTKVMLVQTQDRSDDENLKILLGFKEGWGFYLTNLKSVLEGGLDLRDFTHDIEHRVNY